MATNAINARLRELGITADFRQLIDRPLAFLQDYIVSTPNERHNLSAQELKGHAKQLQEAISVTGYTGGLNPKEFTKLFQNIAGKLEARTGESGEAFRQLAENPPSVQGLDALTPERVKVFKDISAAQEAFEASIPLPVKVPSIEERAQNLPMVGVEEFEEQTGMTLDNAIQAIKGGNALQEMRQGIRQPRLNDFRAANPNMREALSEYQSALRQWRENRSIPVYDVRTKQQRIQNIDTFDPKTAIPLNEFGQQVTYEQAVHNRQQVTGFSLKPQDNGLLKPFEQPKAKPSTPSGPSIPSAPPSTPSAPSEPSGPSIPSAPPSTPSQPSSDAEIEDKFNLELGLKAIDDALKAGQITAEQAAGFRAVLQAWNPEEDMEDMTLSILKKFDELKNSTINPEFKNIVTATALDFFNAKEAQARANEIELSEEAFSAGQRIRQAKGDLERRGLTFGGEAIRQLGPLAAIGQEATGIPGQQALTGPPQAGETFLEGPLGFFREGNVNFQNRLISSSSALRRQQAAQDLARRAEGTLGSTAARGLGLDATLAGGQKGSIEQARLEALGSTLTGLIGQERTNVAQSNPLDLTLT